MELLEGPKIPPLESNESCLHSSLWPPETLQRSRTRSGTSGSLFSVPFNIWVTTTAAVALSSKHGQESSEVLPSSLYFGSKSCVFCEARIQQNTLCAPIFKENILLHYGKKA